MPFFVASALLVWRAVGSRQLHWWAALGCCLGLGALAKYQMILAAVAVFLFWLASGAWRERVHMIGLVLAAAISLAIISPHLYWLFLNDFGPIRYATESSLGASLGGGGRAAPDVALRLAVLLRLRRVRAVLALAVRRVVAHLARPAHAR